MRLFWIVLSVCVLAAAAFIFMPPAQNRPGLNANSPAKIPPPVAIDPNAATATTNVSPSAQPASIAPATTSVSPSSIATTAPTPTSSPSDPSQPTSQPASQPSSQATGQPPAAQQDALSAAAVTTNSTLPTEKALATNAASPDTASPELVELKIEGFTVSPGTTEVNADGNLLVDKRYVIKGDGSSDKPYEVTWEMLTSVDADFDPNAGKKKIPQRIAMLHEKYIKLGGYVAFPMNMQNPKELLLMLNQWDGCCIGVPPTPYDAIEVSLDAIVTGEDRFTTTGSVTGRFTVKPYVVGDWLVGLYVMDRGAMKPRFGGAGDN